MRPLPLAIATRCLNQPLKSALVLAAQFGAGGVQLDCRNELKADELSATGRRELLHRLEEMRLSIASLDFPLRRGLFDPDRLDARIVALKQAMDFASLAALPGRDGSVGPKVPEGKGGHKADLPLAVLSDLAGPVGNHVGVTLALGSRGGVAALPCSKLVRQVSAGPLGINFDPASVVSAGRSPTRSRG